MDLRFVTVHSRPFYAQIVPRRSIQGLGRFAVSKYYVESRAVNKYRGFAGLTPYDEGFFFFFFFSRPRGIVR